MNRFKLYFICLILFYYGVKSQNKIADSLLLVLNQTTVDSQKVKLYGDISWELLSSDINKSLNFAEKELELATKINSEKDIAQAESDVGNIFNRKADYTNAIIHYNKALAMRQKLNQPIKVAGVYTNIATVYMRQNKFKEALDINFKTLKIFENIHDENKQSLVLGNIGNLYYNLKQNKAALLYFTKGLLLARKSNNKTSLANISVNIADIKFEEKDYTSAEFYYNSALLIYIDTDDKYSMATVYNNLGTIASKKNKINLALSYFNLSLKQRIALQDEFGVAQTNLTIGELDLKNANYQQAINHFNTSLKVFIKNNSTLQLEKTYSLLAFAYNKAGDLKLSVINYQNCISIKDSLYVKELTNQSIEMNTKYETDKKQQENELLNTKNKLSETTIKEQRIVTYFIITALLLLAVLAYFIFKGLTHQKKANAIISKQKQLVEHQKDIVDEKQKEILDSIHYAKRIQTALLAHKDFLDINIKNNFVLFKPKDIVSGDFYWATNHENNFYLAVCDSTGHGVPGAFMSILNIGFLSEAIKEKNILEPNKILNYVRNRLIESISKDEQKDGFDGILLCINQHTNQITYASAHNAPVLVSDNKIIDLPKDKMPVGQGERKQEFNLFSVDVKKGDTLYLYTDGYADQFGGEKGKKFKYKPLNELLLANTRLTMVEQNLVLQTTFDNWKGNLEQVDDVLLIGMKI